jgi:hypothetical protein
MRAEIPEVVKRIAEAVKAENGEAQALIVGGWVRDRILERPNKDIDHRSRQHRRRELHGLQSRGSRRLAAARRIEGRSRTPGLFGHRRSDPSHAGRGAPA